MHVIVITNETMYTHTLGQTGYYVYLEVPFLKISLYTVAIIIIILVLALAIITIGNSQYCPFLLSPLPCFLSPSPLVSPFSLLPFFLLLLPYPSPCLLLLTSGMSGFAGC